MQTPQTKDCSTCSTLKCLLPLIDKKLEKLIKNKWNTDSYAASLYFDDNVYSILLRYKRIISKRIFNPKYPSGEFDSQDLISKVKLYINK